MCISCLTCPCVSPTGILVNCKYFYFKQTEGLIPRVMHISKMFIWWNELLFLWLFVLAWCVYSQISKHILPEKALFVLSQLNNEIQLFQGGKEERRKLINKKTENNAQADWNKLLKVLLFRVYQRFLLKNFECQASALENAKLVNCVHVLIFPHLQCACT